MDFLMNQLSVMLNGNCQLPQLLTIITLLSYFPNLHYWLLLLENLGTVKLSCLKRCQRLFVDNTFSRNFMP